MGISAEMALAAARKYTKETMMGAGAIKGDKGDPGAPGRDGQDGQPGQDGAPGQDGVDGQNGKSAYDIWLEHGNTGTEEDFLNSLKGEKGADGTMSFEDLTEEQKESLNGFSPTITPNPDNTDKNYRLDITTKDGTFTTPNLRGGDEVTKYTYVVDGSGITIYYTYVDLSTKVGETVSVTVSNKYGIYETELTVVNIISDTELTVSPGGGEITIVLTNVETTTAELINDNITATTSTWSSQRIANELGQVFDNLTPEQIESLRGPQGDKGEPGVDGSDGEPGANGKSAYDIWLEAGNTGSEEEFLDSLKGEKGDEGQPGQDGNKGDDGFSPIVTVTDTDNGHKVSIEDSEGVKEFEVLDGVNDTEIIHTDLTGFDGVTTVLGLVNALLEEYRTERKNVRFECGSLSNTNLTDLPQAYGYLTIKVGGTNIVEVTFAYSNVGFKSMYYGYLNRESSETLYSELKWDKAITESKKGTKELVANAQNFKIDLTKNNAYWYGMFTFSFGYGTTPCEITVTIIDKVYYTITKGQNVVSAITYTQDGANYTIGIDFTAKIYGTQVVEIPTEFGVVNSFTAEQFTGDTTANLKLDSARTYTTLAELGLDNTATIDDVRGAIPVGGTCMIRTDAFADLTQFNGIQWGYLKITVTANKMSDIWLNDVTSNEALYYGRQSSGNFDKWVKIITDKSDPYACTSYTALTGTEDLFTLPCGHYVSANINTTYNYPITDTNTTAHIYVLGCLNDPVNNKGYRIILYFDNKGRMYRINEWWGVFTDNGWQEIATKPITELTDLGLDGSATIQDVMDKMSIGQHCIINTSRFNDKTEVNNIEYGKVEIRRLSSGMWSLWLEDILHGDTVAHGTCSNGKFAGWHYLVSKSYVDSAVNGGTLGGKAIKSVEIDLSNDYTSALNQVVKREIKGLPTGCKVIRFEGYIISPSDEYVVPKFGTELEQGNIMYDSANRMWRIALMGSGSPAQNKGYIKFYYVE